ncbi:hypothetical protein CC117_32450 [Parafrankia colletiae]|uniref:Uncharacterized protein n=1 Tax=Parafrankia colletiae TaxID=573497 RepID=A0A1S1RCU9_9ACTN|nr:hypothetical protein [Parafrankia colletiae]OHV43887.1 hypothetical protein CC117_32450 [Parafrankia colletiae]
MTATGTGTGLARMVNVRDVVTPSGALALVVPGVQVVAPFVDARMLAQYARERGIPPAGYRVLPFFGLGMIATL